MHDLVIRNGTVVDGSGGPVAPRAPRTSPSTATTSSPWAPTRAWAARDRRRRAPGHAGFVDIHTHYDGQATWDPEISPSSWHGVTTIVMGNCGVGFAPAEPAKRAWLIQLMEGVEDIPGTALAEGMSWNWETFPEYLDELDRMAHARSMSRARPPRRRPGICDGRPRRPERRGDTRRDRGNGQGRARGGRGRGGRLLDDPHAVAPRQGRRAGGGHHRQRQRADRHRPGAGRRPLGVFELASDMFDPEGEFAWMRTIARETGRPVTFNCLQDDLRPEHWRRLVALADEATADGARIVPQVAAAPPRCCSAGTRPPIRSFSTRPGDPSPSCPRAERQARLRDPEVRRAMVTERVEVSGLAAFLTGLAQAVPAGRPARVRAGARTQRPVHRSQGGRHAGGGHLRPDDGRRRPRAAVHPAAGLRPRRLRRLARDARASGFGARVGRRWCALRPAVRRLAAHAHLHAKPPASPPSPLAPRMLLPRTTTKSAKEPFTRSASRLQKRSLRR